MMTVKAYKLNFKLPEPLSISFHTFYYRESVIVELRYNDKVGYGEAAPFKLITGDSQEEVLEQVKTLRTIDLDPKTHTVEDLHAYLRTQNTTAQTLRTALDFAYHDLLGKIKNMPVYRLYADLPTLVDNSVTIFVHDSMEKTTQEVKNLIQSYPDLKIIKIKLKGEHDIERAKVIRATTPAHMQFTVDANQGFQDPEKAVQDLTQIGTILEHLVLAEEPCPKGELEKMKYVTDHISAFPIIADESAATVEDAEKVIAAKAAHGINIKLQKAGGIFPAKHIAALCQKADMKIMVGCMFEGPVAIAAGIHFAVSTPNVILTDLDADLAMPEHTEGKSLFEQGKRVPLEKPGFGISYNFPQLEALQQRGEAVFEQV